MNSDQTQTSNVATFKAAEYLVGDDRLDSTGRTEFYAALNTEEAVNRCLNAHRLHNGAAFVGPSGQIVYCGHLAYAVLQDG